MNETRYENVFCIFLAGLVVLARENPVLVFPDLLYLFVLLLGLNLAGTLSLRRSPAEAWPAALLTVANNAVVAGIVAKSGDERSLFWVLYLLPVYSGRLLLSERAFWLVTAGGVLFNAVPPLLDPALSRPETLLLSGVRSAVILLAAGVLALSLRRERKAARAVLRQREELTRLEAELAGKARRPPAEDALDAAGVLHDARTPLMIIQSSAELAGEPDAAGPLAEHLERIRRSARLCEHVLVQGLERLRTSRTTFAPAGLNDVLRAAEDLCRPGITQHRVSVRFELAEELPQVLVDAMALERVFINLIKNALEAMPSGGTLTLRTETRRAPDGTPMSVRAVVEDDGPGLPPEFLAAGFREGRSAKAGGFGIGLACSRSIVLRHGGSLWAENRPEGGARFTIEIPGGVPGLVQPPRASRARP